MKPSDSSRAHQKLAAERGPVTLAVVTVSDTRTRKTDANARYLTAAVAESGDRLDSIQIVPDEPAQIASALDGLLARDQVQVILFNGGTGISRRDRTFDVLTDRFEKELTGFGELFRMLSYEEIGAAAMLSRASAGVVEGKLVVSMPGSPGAVRLAWERLLRPQLAHLAWELIR